MILDLAADGGQDEKEKLAKDYLDEISEIEDEPFSKEPKTAALRIPRDQK